MRRAVFPGSFDPITLGHVDIVERALAIFDEIILAIGVNASKKYMFSLEQRQHFLRETFKENANVKIKTYEGLTVDFCRQEEADFILRGLRNASDLEFEKAIAQTNQKLTNIETVFLLTSSGKSHISSTIVRDLIRFNGQYKDFVPKAVRL